MKSISFYVQKGGTGKTSMTGNVSRALAEYGTVLTVDGDPQGNLTGWFVNEIEYDLSDVLKGTATVDQAVLRISEELPWYILPTVAIDGELKEWSETNLPSKPFVFQDLAESLQAFDYVVWDMSPGHSLLEKSILASVNELVIVVGAESFSVDGLEILQSSLEKLRRDRRAEFQSDKLIVNRLNRTYSLHNAYHDLIRTLPYHVYTVGQSTAISDCVPQNETVFEYDPRNQNIETFREIARNLS